MVVISDKVKDSMDYDPVEFIIKSGTVERSIIPDGIYTYEKVAGKDRTLAIVESDDIGIVIVLKIFHIHVQQISIGTEDDIYISYLALFIQSNSLEPG
jgi:hypothetical protein